MLNISPTFKLIAGAYLRHLKVEEAKVQETLNTFNELDTGILPTPYPEKQVFANSNAGRVLMNLGTIALGDEKSTDERLNIGIRMVEFYKLDLDGKLSLSSVSENQMY